MLEEGDVYTLIGHAVIERDSGKTDMPAYLLDLASRIATAIGREDLAEEVKALMPANA